VLRRSAAGRAFAAAAAAVASPLLAARAPAAAPREVLDMTHLGRLTLALLLSAAVGIAPPVRPAAAAGDAVTAAARMNKKKARKKVRALLRRSGITRLPSAAGALAARQEGAPLAAAVVGTPPALVDIPTHPIKEVFWQPGVIDAIVAGTPSPAECSQFFAGGTDGASGGLGACHMAESVGYSFARILEGGRSLCYMKLLPTPENVAAGGVSVVSGELPGGDVTRVFSVPAGSSPRLVKVAVTGDPGGREGNQDVFLRVSPEAANRAAGNFYKVDLWFCNQGPSAPARGYDRITIERTGHYTDESAETSSGDGQGGNHVATIEGYLTFADGNVSYDRTRGRRARVEAVFGGNAFRGDVEITSDDTMLVKTYDAGAWGARMGYVVNAFSGTGPDTLRFLAGAFKERHSFDGVTFNPEQMGATEFRTSFYAAAPGSELVAALDAVDLLADPFYATPPSPAVDTSGLACDATPDVVLALDFTNPTVRAASAPCEDRRFEGMHFCHEDADVRQADTNYWSACSPGPH
jgi:hypothetical protein